MVKKNKRTGIVSRITLLQLLGVILLLAVIVVVLEATNTTHIFHKKEPAISSNPASKAITQLPKHAAANNGEKKNSSSSTVNQGTATDNNGVPSANTDPSTWNRSESGVVTVKQPAASATIRSGATLSGTATASTVNYRLTDDQVGVISESTINVVNGNFSASIGFQAHGKSGRLDVFTTDPNGRETNEVQIPVTF